MKNAKRIIAIVMAAFILCQGFAVVSAEDGTADTPTDEIVWTYDNSIIVTIRVDEAKVFTPNDFSEVGCIKVLVITKMVASIGYRYRLMLIFDTTVDSFNWEAAVESLRAIDGVESTERNFFAPDYSERMSVLTLSESEVCLVLGESIDIEIQEKTYCMKPLAIKEIIFKINPNVIDESTLTKETFSEYGIRFWPLGRTSADDTDYAEKEGTASIIHTYSMLVYECEEERYWEADVMSYDVANEYLTKITALANTEGIDEIYSYDYLLPPGMGCAESWSVDNEQIVDMTLCGGYIPDYYNTVVDRTATLVGTEVGVAVLTCSYGIPYRGAARGQCIIHVYDPKDINGDGVSDSLDAAYLLKYDAGLLDQTQLELAEGDVNGDGRVDSLDAALILKYDAGIGF